MLRNPAGQIRANTDTRRKEKTFFFCKYVSRKDVWRQGHRIIMCRFYLYHHNPMQRNSLEVLCRTLAKLPNSNTHTDKRTCQQRKESNRRHVSATSRTHLHSRCTPTTGKNRKIKWTKCLRHRQTCITGKIGEERLSGSQHVGSVVSPVPHQQYSHWGSLSQIGFKTTGNKLENCIFYSLMTPDDGWKVGSWACTWVMRQRRRLPAASQL